MSCPCCAGRLSHNWRVFANMLGVAIAILVAGLLLGCEEEPKRVPAPASPAASAPAVESEPIPEPEPDPEPEPPYDELEAYGVRRIHDDSLNVTCWLYGQSIACLRDRP